jgi:hypothetical protein
MAFNQKYVTQASAGGTGTIGDPWDFATAIANAAPLDCVNIQSDAPYSIGATTFPAGTFDAPIIWRGYNTTIGDCDNLGRNADGTLNTTGMPEITVTGIWTPAAYITFQSLNVTSSLTSAIISSGTVDYMTVVSCRFENEASAVNARIVTCDDNCLLLNSDLVCSGATSDYIVSFDVAVRIVGCRFEIASTDSCCEINAGCVVIDSVFIKTGSLGGSAIAIDLAAATVSMISGCTFYNFTNAISSTVTHTAGFLILSENHCTDCTNFVSNTTNIACYDIRNRTRDAGTAATVELITVGAITTAGSIATDYVDAAAGDLHLITTAPGYNAGWDGSDIGGLQTDPPAASGGGTLHQIIGAA